MSRLTDLEIHKWHQCAAKGQVMLEAALPQNHPYLAGHFVGHPVFPGVAQLEVIHELVQTLLGRPLTLVAIEKAKFSAILKPPLAFVIEVQVDYQQAKGHWLWRSADHKFSQGGFHYAT